MPWDHDDAQWYPGDPEDAEEALATRVVDPVTWRSSTPECREHPTWLERPGIVGDGYETKVSGTTDMGEARIEYTALCGMALGATHAVT